MIAWHDVSLGPWYAGTCSFPSYAICVPHLSLRVRYVLCAPWADYVLTILNTFFPDCSCYLFCFQQIAGDSRGCEGLANLLNFVLPSYSQYVAAFGVF